MLPCNIQAKLHVHFYSMPFYQGPLGLPGRPGDPGEKGDTGKPGLSVSSLTLYCKMTLCPEKDKLKDLFDLFFVQRIRLIEIHLYKQQFPFLF